MLYFQLNYFRAEGRERVREMADKLEALHDSLSEKFERFKNVIFEAEIERGN